MHFSEIPISEIKCRIYNFRYEYGDHNLISPTDNKFVFDIFKL